MSTVSKNNNKRSSRSFFSPASLRSVAEHVATPAACFSALLLPFALRLALIDSPPDYLQGEAVRIMYVHVPAAWIALGTYVLMGVFCIIGLLKNVGAMFAAARAAALPGAVFCFLCLATGALWGKPVWGTWWVRDARLVSMLILFFFYLSYLLLLRSYGNEYKAERIAAVLCVLGLINVPIVKYSVEWWNTLHQPSGILRSGGSSVHPAMLKPLIAMFLAYAGIAVTAGMLRFLSLLDRKKLRRLEMLTLKKMMQDASS